MTNEVSGKGSFSFRGVEKMCDFHSRPDCKAVKLAFGQKTSRYEVHLRS